MSASMIASLERARARGKGREAVIIAERAAGAGLAHPLVFRVLADARRDQGRFSEAGALLNRALALAPEDPATLVSLGLLLIREGRPAEAVDPLARALRAEPGRGEAWIALGNALEILEEDEEAHKAYLQAATCAPEAAAPHAGIAEISRRAGRLEAAEASARRALALARGDPMASLALARTLLASGRPEAAREAAEGLLIRRVLDPALEPLALKTLADALDRLGRIPEAVKAYGRMNQAIVTAHGERFGPRGAVENHFAFMERLEASYSADAEAWRARPAPGQTPDAGGPRAHVFVLGYPRSGNTLAAAVLGALEDALVLEERPTLTDVDLAFLRDAQGLSRLARLTPQDAQGVRADYFARAAAASSPLHGRVLVDMSPLNSLKIPIIAKLFPQARIVYCVRDPRDVILSCWRQSFRVNAATFQMTSLEGTRRHLLAATALAERGAALAADAVYRLDYDRLMDDFEAGARALVAGAGLVWSDVVLDFSARARGRALRTASAGQIQSGLFDGRGQWRAYEAALGPVLEGLAPAPA